MKTIILSLIAILTCAFSFAQTNKEEKTPQQEERGKALKQWFDSGDIIIDCYIEDQTWISTEKKEGYLCDKVKINRILKGKLNVGYINLKTAGQKAQPPMDINYPDGYDVRPKGHLLMRIVKTDYTKEGFITENKGVYEPDPYGHRFILNYSSISFHVNDINGGKDYLFSNINDLYKNIQEYCGIDLGLPKTTPEEKPVEKKSLKSTDVNKSTDLKKTNDIPYEQKVKKRKELVQFMQTKLQQRNKYQSKSSGGCSELFISEYLDGTNKNKSVEIYNPTTSAINLTNYSILIYSGSSYTPVSISLTGTISAQSTFVISNNQASAAVLAKTNQTSHNLQFDGDEAIVLKKQTTHIDKIGEIGVNIGSAGWTVTPNGSTTSHDLRRKYSISTGDTSWNTCKNEWNIFPKDSIHNLGQHQNFCSIDPYLNLSFANPYTTDSIGNKYFEFDIMASSTGANTYLDFTEIDITYNSAAFGTNAVLNGTVTVNRGANFNYSTYNDPNSSLLNGQDTILILFRTNIDSSQTSWNRQLITSTPVQLLRVIFKVQNCNQNANIQFFNTFFTSMFAFYDANANDDPNISANSISYDNVNYPNALNYTIPCGAQITSFYPASVIAGAYYTGIPNNESQLTINGSGFGNNKGTILMKNAVNNGNPFYIPLDDYDIPIWTNNLIEVNVPSILSQTNPYVSIGAYPGTGYFYVKPDGSTDSVKSPSILQIPYILKDVSTNIPSKERLTFAYRNVRDSSGTADSAAYWFRFDIATVTNNPNPYCRQLLKQAIQDWACALDIRYRIGTDTTITTTTSDGISYITFKNVLSNPAFIAETYISANYCNGNFYSTEADISLLLNPSASGYANWYYVRPDSTYLGNTILNTTDLFDVALHELGHASLLLHVNDSTDLMYFKIFQNVPRGSIGSISNNDQSGGVDDVVYSKTLTYPVSGCPFNPFQIPAIISGACVSPNQGVESIGSNTFQLSVYPNPASQVLNITFVKEKESNNTVKLTTITGQTIFYKNIGKNEGANEVINIAELAKGLYILVVTDNANTVYKKIIIE